MNGTHSISSVYGDSFVDLNGLSSHKCIGIDGEGKYMCVDTSSFYILESLEDTSRLYTYAGLLNPDFAIQINSGRYIVNDPGNKRIIELKGLGNLENLVELKLPSTIRDKKEFALREKAQQAVRYCQKWQK